VGPSFSRQCPCTLTLVFPSNGDYQRYLAESAEGETRSALVEKSLESYKTAWEIAVSKLPATDPTRLGLALNFSVFYFELLESPDRACHLAKHAFDTALETLDDLPEDDAADSIHILQLLKDNLSLWLEQMEIFRE
jgi:14-3-3 protein epsilon